MLPYYHIQNSLSLLQLIILFYFTVDYLKYFSRDVVLERIEDSGKMLTQQAIDDAVVAMTTQFGVSKVRMLIIELKVTKQK